MHHCPAAQRSLRISSVGHQMIPEHTGYNIKQRQPFRIKRLIKVKTLNLPTNFFFLYVGLHGTSLGANTKCSKIIHYLWSIVVSRLLYMISCAQR